MEGCRKRMGAYLLESLGNSSEEKGMDEREVEFIGAFYCKAEATYVYL